MTSTDFDRRRRALVRTYGGGNNVAGMLQVANTLLPLALLWAVALAAWPAAPWITVLATVGITLFLIRVFSLMHECGHGSLFGSRWLNRAWGFVFGVISGMPQFVWAQHHDFHHRHNGNWERYRGPLSTLTTEQYAALGTAGQRRFRLLRHLALAPLGGFVYLIFNPRFNWIKGNVALLAHLLRLRPAATFQTRYWKNWREYRHMSANNVALAGVWYGMSAAFGADLFFGIYLPSLSVAGGVGIMLFTVQHNFEHAYAADTAAWDSDRGALEGTSYLVLPAWMNWFTADIGYHHVHHLSAAIPNYRLARCHRENADLFTQVRRLRLRDVPASLRCLLWDQRAQRIVSFAEFERHRAAVTSAR